MGSFHHRIGQGTDSQQAANDRILVLRVASGSPVRGLAGSIAHALRQHEQIVLRAIGSAAVNQAVKATALARQHLAAEGIDIAMIPSMRKADVEGHGRAVMELAVARG